jgi:regulator of protease activity HflC (stomatin/prohibitin superfamily)
MIEVISPLLPAGIVLFAAVLVVATAVRIVPAHKRFVVLRFGRFLGVYGPGLFILIPFVDRAVEVNLREQLGKIEDAEVTTQDDKRVRIDLVWLWKVVDPAKSVLEVENLERSLEEMAIAALKTQIRGMARSEALVSRRVLKERVQTQLVEIANPWGVEVRDVEVREIRRT